MNAVLDDFAEHWLIYVSMPFIAAAIGYVTKRVAIEMMFHPVDFVGINGTFIGWQGVVPRSSERMIGISAELLTTKLVNPREVLARLDPARIAEEVEQPLLSTMDDVAREVLEQHHPRLWEMLPVLAQDLVVKQVQAAAPVVVRRIVNEIQENVDEVLDVKHIAVTALHRDRRLTVRLIREISRPEMAFIARSGIYFGFVLGLVQTIVWALTKEPLVLPVFGAIIGLFTDWLAIKLIFFPREEKRVLGLFRFQGIFQRRRDEVAEDFGRLVATEVMTVPNIVEGILRGPRSDRIIASIQEIVARTIDEQTSVVRPLVSIGVGSQRFEEMKHAAADRAVARMSDPALQAGGYVAGALDIGNTIARRMRRLSRVEYENLLRPAFRRDEWKLIAVGAMIGFGVGELQTFLLPG
ncbi:uncharacterized protein DUF445 [Herbihabitans rhizosphaerae]|uniref:Uncharacterized protein DUF445 n=1 Tax=Herbihabitans rhizosphaerae TaxID=1872711 RepID=A0A4Q7KVS9_9PSEU|nr:DUF445 family protein [Herbihabitans rhizosphaerae]RZS41158.1 uncharacterized protein DUF445 [Herbihabitans rhizosphaerae]